MMIKAILEGKPLGYPLHPAVIHFPIGLFLLTVLLDLANLVMGVGNPLARAAFYVLSLGLIAAFIAIILGLVDRTEIRADHPARRTANLHMILNLTATGLFALSWWLRSGAADQNMVPLLPLILALAGNGMIFYSGCLGGGMVYGDGIAVGRHLRKTDLPDATIFASTKDSSDGYARVASADSLKDDEILRADVDGYVMAIARVGANVYAFQEFCTHRYGPLSEGAFEDHNIICPWHSSCFDMRTGKVIQGPAKVDLKVYEARIVDDEIQVRVPRE
jgi:nitrite reductase/ring-hydroxylating ferredoxin subunit/uncharacterized membrane protein